MKYNVITEIYEPAGVYPIATKPETLYTPEPDTTAGRRAAFSQYGTRVHSGKFTNGRRWWKHQKEQGGYIHITTIKDYATEPDPEHLDAHATEEEPVEDERANTAQTTIRAGKDEYNRPNVYAIWQTAGTWYSAQIWQAEKGKALDRGEAINVQPHATRQEALARRRALADQAEAEERHDRIEQHRKEIVRNRSIQNRNIRNDAAPASPTAPRQQEQAAADQTAAPEQMPLF